MLGFGIVIDDNVLKYNGQCPRLIYVLVMLTIFSKYLLWLTISLKCFYKILSSLEVDKLLYFIMAIMNSSLEKGFCYNSKALELT